MHGLCHPGTTDTDGAERAEVCTQGAGSAATQTTPKGTSFEALVGEQPSQKQMVRSDGSDHSVYSPRAERGACSAVPGRHQGGSGGRVSMDTTAEALISTLGVFVLILAGFVLFVLWSERVTSRHRSTARPR